jgi:hypothetical protein
MVPQCHDTTLPLCNGATVPRCHGATVPRCHGATVSQCHGATVPRCHGAMVPRCHGATVPLCHFATPSTPLLLRFCFHSIKDFINLANFQVFNFRLSDAIHHLSLANQNDGKRGNHRPMAWGVQQGRIRLQATRPEGGPPLKRP